MPTRRRNTRRDLLSRPRGGINLGVHYDPEAFGRFSEAVARFLGTARFLVAQTALVVVWIAVNVGVVALRWDPYPFILLNLAFSTQAAYAAPLILLAQNRQAERERQTTEHDRQITQRTQAEAEFLAREMASVRLGLADSVTTDDIDHAVDRITSAIERQLQRHPEPGNESGVSGRSIPELDESGRSIPELDVSGRSIPELDEEGET